MVSVNAVLLYHFLNGKTYVDDGVYISFIYINTKYKVTHIYKHNDNNNNQSHQNIYIFNTL